MFPSTSKEGHFVPLTEDFQWDPIFFIIYKRTFISECNLYVQCWNHWRSLSFATFTSCAFSECLIFSALFSLKCNCRYALICQRLTIRKRIIICLAARTHKNRPDHVQCALFLSCCRKWEALDFTVCCVIFLRHPPEDFIFLWYLLGQAFTVVHS